MEELWKTYERIMKELLDWLEVSSSQLPTFGPALLVALPSARDKTAGHREGLPRHSAAIRK